MRRVFPLRPAETSLLVTYDNGAFELHHVDASAPALSSSAGTLKHRSRSRSTDLSLPDSSSPPRAPFSLQKPPFPAEYSQFAETGSPSPRSSLWTSSVPDNGDSTSFNSSSATHRGHTSHFSSSSSSSVNFNPADTGSPRRALDAQFEDKNSSAETPAAHSDASSAPSEDLNVNLRVKTRTSGVNPPAGQPPTDDFLSEKLQELSLPETPTYVIPRQVEEYMQKCLDTPPDRVRACRSATAPKVPERTCESRKHGRSDIPPCAPAKAPVQAYDVSRCSCSVPFKKYITKCMKRGKRSPSLEKDEPKNQTNSSSRFSTSLNGLYNPPASSEAKCQLDNDCGRRILSSRAESRKLNARCNNLSSNAASLTSSTTSRGTLSSSIPGFSALKVSEGRPIADDSRGSSSTRKSFVSAMVNDYVQHLQDKPKSLSFRKTHGPASFHCEADLIQRPRSASVDFTSRSGQLIQDYKADFQTLPAQRFGASSTQAIKEKSGSVDLLSGAGRSGKIFSGRVEINSAGGGPSWTSDLRKAEENNMHTFALLKLEINKLCKEKKLLAKELAAEMNAHHCQRKTAENVVRDMEAEMEERLISVEKDHALAKASLQQEMDRRAEEWRVKLCKIRTEEKKLRERVTKMALERVELQKAIAFHKSREACLQAKAEDNEISAKTWMQRHHQAEEEVRLLRKSLTNASNKLGDKERELDLLLQTSKALGKENVLLCEEFGRLSKAYGKQEVMFRDVLKRLVAIVNGPADSKVESLRKLHGEVNTFANQEQALRNEIDVLQYKLLEAKQRALTCAGGSDLVVGNTMYSPEERLRSLNGPTLKSLVSKDDSMKRMQCGQWRSKQAQHQLELKEEEVGLLESALKERDIAVKDVQDELISVKTQRDSLRKQVQQMNQEALGLNREIDKLRQVIEKLDDELMLKEGEISILRNTCSESDFFE